MNRAQRRATGAPKEPTYTLTRSQIEQIKKECTDRAADTAFKLMLCIPTMVIHDHYSKIVKKEGRLETFVDLVLDMYDSYNRDSITLEELEERLKAEAGITFDEIKKRGIY